MKNQLSILIVDDNLQFINRIIGLIEDIQISKDIHIATGFNDALEQLELFHLDILLLDINLPGKSGIDVLRYVRQYHSDTEVIMLTNHTDEVYREQCAALGARFFLDKSNDYMQVPEILAGFYLQLNERSGE